MSTNDAIHPDQAVPPLLVSVLETRRLLGGIGKTTVYSMMAKGDLGTCKIGRRRMVTMESVERYAGR